LRYAFLNEAAARLYGMSVDEVLGHGQCELFPSVKELGIWDSYLGVIESGSPVTFDVPWFQENGIEGSFTLTATRFGDGLLISANDMTRAKRAEQAGEQERDLLRATMDSLMDPHVLLEAVRDETGQIVDFTHIDANSAACAYLGFAPGELVGKRMLDRSPGVVGAGLLHQYAQVVETGEPLLLEDVAYSVEAMGGQERYLDISAARVGDGLSFTWRDVTDRRLAIEAAQRTATVLESSGEAIMSATLDGVVTSWNPACERLYGYSGGEIIGKPSRPLIPDDRVQDQRAMLDEVKAGRTIENLETLRIRKDGTVIPVALTVSPIREADGNVVGVSAIARDLRTQEEAAHLSRSMIEASLDSMVVISPEGKITDANQATVRFTGVAREELVGTSFSDYFTEPEKAEEVYQRVLTQESVADYPLTLRHRDGHETYTEVLYNASIYRDTHGKVLGVFAAARDVTKQVLAQREAAHVHAKELDRLAELERFQRVTVGRELKMIELKKHIEELEKRGHPQT
jgi:PAS domain S-box-containing protein